MAGLIQQADGVRANVAGSANNKNIHIRNLVRAIDFHSRRSLTMSSQLSASTLRDSAETLVAID